MKTIIRMAAMAVVLVGSATFAGEPEHGYALTEYGSVWRDSQGECVLSPYRQSEQPACEAAPVAAVPEPMKPAAPTPAEPVTLETSVRFDFDKSAIKPEAAAQLDVLLQDMGLHKTHRIEIDGHTCYIGTEEYNQGLSERRAEAVRRYLVNKGIRDALITTRGYGESRPMFGNEQRDTRCLNRRAEVRVTAVPAE